MILATLCYVQQNGYTLMVHRNKKRDDIHAGKWNGLGGKLEPGETPEECVLREVYEESGLRLKRPRLRGLLIFLAFGGDDWYVFVFTATEFTGSLTESPEGDLRWIPDTELATLPLWAGDHIFFPWLRQERFFSAKFVYAGEQLMSYEVAFHPPAGDVVK